MKKYKSRVLISLLVLFALMMGVYSGFVAQREGFHSALHSRIVGHTPPCCQEEVAMVLSVGIEGDHDLFVDAVREFVNENSIRPPIGSPHGFPAYDTGGVIRSLLAASRGTGKHPHLLCSSRANAMGGILETFGIKSRQVHLYSQNNGSHTFIEVQNPVTGIWVVHDPDYNIFWVNRQEERRIGLGEMVTTPTEKIVPCRVLADCDWNLGKHLRSFLGVGVYFDFDGPPHVLINRNRFDPATLLPYSSPPQTLEKYISGLWSLDHGSPVVSIVSGAI